MYQSFSISTGASSNCDRPSVPSSFSIAQLGIWIQPKELKCPRSIRRTGVRVGQQDPKEADQTVYMITYARDLHEDTRVIRFKVCTVPEDQWTNDTLCRTLTMPRPRTSLIVVQSGGYHHVAIVTCRPSLLLASIMHKRLRSAQEGPAVPCMSPSPQAI